MSKWFSLSVALLIMAASAPAHADWFGRLVRLAPEEPEQPAPPNAESETIGDPVVIGNEPVASGVYGYPFASRCCEPRTHCCDSIWDGFCSAGRCWCTKLHSWMHRPKCYPVKKAPCKPRIPKCRVKPIRCHPCGRPRLFGWPNFAPTYGCGCGSAVYGMHGAPTAIPAEADAAGDKVIESPAVPTPELPAPPAAPEKSARWRLFPRGLPFVPASFQF